MKRIFFALILMSVIVLPLAAQDYKSSDFDAAFQDATKMTLSGVEAAKGTDLLVRDTASVLHREQMAILDELAKLHKEIADLKKDIKAIKSQVE